MDRRQQKTRESIFVAFTTLLSHKNYSKITVQEIIDQANVGRSTFYTHFETKDELLKEMCNDLFAHIFSDEKSTELTHDFSLMKNEPFSMLTHILYHIRDNKNMISILSCESSDLFIHYFKSYLETLIQSHMLHELKVQKPNIPEEFLLNCISASFVSTIQWWLNKKMKETPEEISRYFLSLLNIT